MSETVLVIDDDCDLALMTTLWVRAAGYQCLMAHNGPSGIQTAQKHRPDIILLDIMMPGMDGFEVSRQLKENPELVHIPIIFVSAKVQENARREAFAAGGKFFLSKPYEGDNLIAAIAAALDSTKSLN
jgi:CheY-like chemotaxis protein